MTGSNKYKERGFNVDNLFSRPCLSAKRNPESYDSGFFSFYVWLKKCLKHT